MFALDAWTVAILRSSLPPTARHVALTLAFFVTSNSGSASASYSRLMQATGLSRGAVRTHVRGLIEAGWIERTTKGGWTADHHGSILVHPVYTLRFP
jgi:hypothetical protein